MLEAKKLVSEWQSKKVRLIKSVLSLPQETHCILATIHSNTIRPPKNRLIIVAAPKTETDIGFNKAS